MAASMANLLRRYLGTQARDIRLEQQLADQLDHSARRLDWGLIDAQSSPSRQASHREQAVLLANALDQLPKDYREVIILRHLEGLSFPDVSRRMQRSLDSVEKLCLVQIRREEEVQRIEEKQRQNYIMSRGEDTAAAVTIRRETAKVGRNDPCPCGSGKKYKKCCGL